MKVKLLAITPQAEKVIELAGRTCYLSFQKVAKDSEKKFIRFLIQSGHASVLEHAYATFRLQNISRSLTHQLVRHRVASYSQQSQRYVDEKNFGYVIPDSIRKNKQALALYQKFMHHSKEIYTQLREMNIVKEDARFVLPNGVKTEIVISANLREFRHIFKLRCHIKAQWEIRQVCIKMLEILKKKAPTVFEDFQINDTNMTASTQFTE